MTTDTPATGVTGATQATAAWSEEQFAQVDDDLRLCYQTVGDPRHPTLLLVMGLAGPMTWWPEELCERLAARGFHVVRFDNRDTGRSSRIDHGRLSRRALVRGKVLGHAEAPYTLSDMAEDAVRLLDVLEVDAAHVMGISMGGMIGQTLAVEHPDRVLSLTSVMSTTGRRLTGWQDPKLLPGLINRAARGREAYVERSVAFWNLIRSPGFPVSAEKARERAEQTWDRGISFSGIMRQMMAVVTQPDRTRALGSVRVPVTVVHGLKDRMVHVSGGRATARAIPGAELMLVPGMGHDMPPGVWDVLVDAVSRSARRSSRPPA